MRKNGSCFDCKSSDCICCQVLVTRFSRIPKRFKIILVDDVLGFRRGNYLWTEMKEITMDQNARKRTVRREGNAEGSARDK